MAKTQPALETRSTSPASGSSRPSTSTRRSGSSAGGPEACNRKAGVRRHAAEAAGRTYGRRRCPGKGGDAIGDRAAQAALGRETVGTDQRCACSGTAVDEVVRRRATPGWDGGHRTGVADRHGCNCDQRRPRRGDEVDPDQEMVGIGTSNIAAGLFQGFAVSVSGCRAAVVDQSGARAQLAGLVGAGLLAVLLLFLNDPWPTFLRPPWPLSSSLRLYRSWT